MTIDVATLKERLRAHADAAAAISKAQSKKGFTEDALFSAGRQAAFVTALRMVEDAEDAEHERRDWAERFAEGVNLGAVRDLEEFARSAGGAVDMASGTVYTDAEGGL